MSQLFLCHHLDDCGLILILGAAALKAMQNTTLTSITVEPLPPVDKSNNMLY